MANFNLNEIKLAGRLTADPELKQTPNGVATVTFNVAVSRRYEEPDGNGGKTRKADFFNVVAWRERAEFVCRYFRKGTSVYVCGEMHNRKWTDNQGVTRYTNEIVADDIRFVDSKAEQAATAEAQSAAAGYAAPAPMEPPPNGVPNFEVLNGEEELPF